MNCELVKLVHFFGGGGGGGGGRGEGGGNSHIGRS